MTSYTEGLPRGHTTEALLEEDSVRIFTLITDPRGETGLKSGARYFRQWPITRLDPESS